MQVFVIVNNVGIKINKELIEKGIRNKGFIGILVTANVINHAMLENI